MTKKFLNHNNLINTMKRIKQLLTITAISLCCSISNAQSDNRLYLTLENIEHSTEAGQQGDCRAVSHSATQRIDAPASLPPENRNGDQSLP